MLGVIPFRRDSVAVIVVHHQRLVRATAARRVLDELVHQAMIEGLLLVAIAMIHVTGERLRVVEPLWIS